MKASAGTVQTINNNGRIALRWTYQGRRFKLSVGLPFRPESIKAVAGRIAQIEKDIAYGELDTTLAKYKPQAVGVTVTPKVPSLQELWDKYTEFRSPSLSPNTLIKVYGAVAADLERCPYGLDNPAGVRDWLVQKHPPDFAKRIMTRINACTRWAVQSGLIPTNPFVGMAASITIPKGERGGDEIDPFTLDERAAIIAGFESSPYYRHYAPLVRFLFLTGCRPGEALALEWGHITDGAIHFQQASVIAKANTIKPGLKTQSNRKFPINRQLQELLDNIPRVNKLVFPSPTGRIIDWTNFRARAWVTVLKNAGIRFRKPYQTRHTFITEALRRGLSVQDVAKLVGNSPQVIYQHYAGASRELVVPEL